MDFWIAKKKGLFTASYEGRLLDVAQPYLESEATGSHCNVPYKKDV